MELKRKLKMGMVGGGPGAFIGAVHRKASALDGQIVLVAGAFDINPRKSKKMGRELFLDSNRVYTDYNTMIEKELALPVGERIDFVTVATPNNWHFPIARDFLNAGFHVMCEKPMTINVKQARQLRDLVKKKRLVFGLMHNYTGYPMVKLAREMVAKGDLGKIRKVVVQYPQAWLATALESTGQMQASWRCDPKQSGGGAIGDIGSHAENLAEYVTGLKITHVCADLGTFVKGRKVDDDCNCLLKFNHGASGVLHASQIAVGQENNLAIWVHGEKGAVEWHQEDPNYLIVDDLSGGARQVWSRGNAYVGAYSAAAGRATRLPSGHPEGFLEAFANNYMNFSDTVRAKLTRTKPDPLAADFPGVEEGLRGMLFIETVQASAKSKQKWTKMKT